MNIRLDRNYRRLETQDIFTGQQILNLMTIASPLWKAMIILDIVETDLPATSPKSKYGPVGASTQIGTKERGRK